MKNKILYIAPSPRVKGGISTVINNILSSELKKKFKIQIIASHVDGPKFKKLIAAMTGFVSTMGHLAFGRYDIVHIHTGDVLSCKRKYFFFVLVRQFSCKTVIHFHGASFLDHFPTISAQWKDRIQNMFGQADKVICLSETWKTQLLRISPEASIQVVNNFVPVPDVKPAEKKVQAVFEITFLGLIGERKGIFDLIDAIKKIKDEGFPVHLNVGGNGDIPRLKKAVTKLGLKNHVTYLGWVNGRDKDALFRNTHLFVLPSYGEGMPMSVLEAMSYGIAVISTNVGGIPELIQDGVTGMIIPPGDIGSLIAAITKCIRDDQFRQELGRNARASVQKKYNVENMTRKIEKIYQSLLN